MHMLNSEMQDASTRLSKIWGSHSVSSYVQ